MLSTLAKLLVTIIGVIFLAHHSPSLRAQAQDLDADTKRVAYVVPFLSDTAMGHGAGKVNCTLYKLDANSDAKWTGVDTAETWWTGHAQMLLDSESAVGSVYKMVLATEPYYVAQNLSTFYPYVEVIFERLNEDDFLLIPILVSPYSYSAMIGHA